MWVDVDFDDIDVGDVFRIKGLDEDHVKAIDVCQDDSMGRTITIKGLDGCYQWMRKEWQADDDEYERWESDQPLAPKTPTSTFEEDLDAVMLELKVFLMAKNAKYGNSALEPVRVFSQADAREQLRVRMDDKLNRIMNNNGDEDEDVMKDLVGYWFLDRILERRGL